MSNKFFAKIASDKNKPNGLYLITPAQGVDFVAQLPVGDFYGVGKVTEYKMHALGIQTGADLRQFSLATLQQHFGKSALFFYHIVQGIDDRAVNPYRTRKSIGTETTYAKDLQETVEIYQQLHQLFAKTFLKVQEKKLHAWTLTVKIKYHNFKQITRSLSFKQPIKAPYFDDVLLRKLLQKDLIGQNKVRLLGVTLSALEQQSLSDRQMDLFE
jgi:DNA polymerase-4